MPTNNSYKHQVENDAPILNRSYTKNGYEGVLTEVLVLFLLCRGFSENKIDYINYDI